MTNDPISQWHHLFRKWLFFEAALPVAYTVLLFWPVSSIISPMTHPFERVFSSADLIPLSALIFLGLASELDQWKMTKLPDSQLLEYFRDGAIGLSVLYLWLYGFCRTEYMRYNFPTGDKPVDENMTWIACASLIVVGFTFLCSLAAKIWVILSTIRLQTSER